MAVPEKSLLLRTTLNTIGLSDEGGSLNLGCYLGVVEANGDAVNFMEQWETLSEELETPEAEARDLEERIAGNAVKILER